jgi:hypothetical protein
MPEFNWRDVRFDEPGLIVTLPGKATSMSRSIDLAGNKVQMTMNGVKVNEVSYTVAWINIDSGQAEATLKAMALGMTNNIAAKTKQFSPSQISLIDGSGKVLSKVAGQRLSASGEGANALQLEAIFVSHRNKVFQVVALGPRSAFGAASAHSESAKQFLESVRLVQ